MKKRKLESDNASISSVKWVWAFPYGTIEEPPESKIEDCELHMWIEFKRTA